MKLLKGIQPRREYFCTNSNKNYCFVLLALTLSISSFAQNSTLVSLNNGSLSYTTFAMEGQSNAVNVIPDFSFAGYKGGGVALPTAPVQVTLSPSGGNDTQAIQNAIDAVEAMSLDANGFRGAVLLTKGCYTIDQLSIEKSGVVLRGEGQGIDGTILYAQLQTQHTVIQVQGSGSGFDKDNNSKQEITSAYVPVGANSFDVVDASSYSVGDTIVVVRTPNQTWIDELGMDATTLCAGAPSCVGWTTSSYTISHERVITAIASNTITVNIPIVDVMETQYGGGEIYKASIPGRIEQCGVEHLRIRSYYDSANNEDESHGWTGIEFKRVVNSWVQNVTGEYLGFSLVSIDDESNFNTIQECAMIDHISKISGGRRYSFYILNGLGNLFQRNYSREGRHDFVTSSRLTGPNVFLDSYSANTHSDIGPHHRWATGLLYDNIRGGQIQVQNRGASGTGHGWAGNTTMFWNLFSYYQNIKVESPKGGINWGIGCVGLIQEGGGFWDSWNANVVPRSLYLQQLEDRLGAQAVSNITIPEQLTGNIYDKLEAWAGEYDFGVASNTHTVLVSEDAYVQGGTSANDNYGSSDALIVKETGSSTSNTNRRSFLKFDLSQVSAPVYNVKLRLYLDNDAPGAAQNSVHLVTDDSWTEGAITWNNQPAVSTLLGTKDVPAQNTWLEYDITSTANTEINGDGILSVRLSETTIGNFYAFASKDEDGTSLDPQIVYEIYQNPAEDVCEQALPVHWLTFSGKCENEQVKLHWQTASEQNNEGFFIEKMVDNEWREIGFVQGNGTTTKVSDYEFIDRGDILLKHLYRLKQVDFDGAFEYSNTIAVDCNNKKTSFHLFPNPTTERLIIEFEQPISTNIEIWNILGQSVFQKLINTDNQLVLNIQHLQSGIYFIKIGNKIRRIVKK